MAPSLLDEYEAKRAEWIACMAGEDQHAIMQELIRLTLDVIAFRTLNESLRLAPNVSDDPEDGVRVNGMLIDLLRRSFVHRYVVGLIRLADRWPITGSKGVYSLISLLNDMIAHVHLLTRENIFAGEGLPLDPTAWRNEERERLSQAVAAGEDAFYSDRNRDPARIDDLHRDVDVLCEFTSEDDRSESDQVSNRLLEALRDRVITLVAAAKEYRDKVIAHASTPESLKEAKTPLSLSMNELWEVHRGIVRIAHALNLVLLKRTNQTFSVLTPFDRFEYLDQPLATPQAIEELRGYWKSLETEVGSWRANGPSDLWELAGGD